MCAWLPSSSSVPWSALTGSSVRHPASVMRHPASSTHGSKQLRINVCYVVVGASDAIAESATSRLLGNTGMLRPASKSKTSQAPSICARAAGTGLARLPSDSGQSHVSLPDASGMACSGAGSPPQQHLRPLVQCTGRQQETPALPQRESNPCLGGGSMVAVRLKAAQLVIASPSPHCPSHEAAAPRSTAVRCLAADHGTASGEHSSLVTMLQDAQTQPTSAWQVHGPPCIVVNHFCPFVQRRQHALNDLRC